MNPRRRLLFALWLLLAAPGALAQQAQRVPHIGYVYPAGGRQGATFQVSIGGQFLDGVSAAQFSGDGIDAKIIEHIKPMPPAQAQQLRDELEQLMDRKMSTLVDNLARRSRAASQPTTRSVWNEQDETKLAELRKKLSTFVLRPSSMAISEATTLQVTIAPGAAAGPRELRLQTRLGLTNPLVFYVDQLPEYAEPTVIRSAEPRRSVAAGSMSIQLPAIVNGQIGPGGVDRYRFQARAGQSIVAIVAARQLIPYLPDAVPGWFQALLTLRDPAGEELAFSDDWRFDPDPVLHYRIPRDGHYTLEIRDALYRGREDFVYRIAVGELPFITGVFPLGARGNSNTSVELRGWNLPVSRLTPDTQHPGLQSLTVRKAGRDSNSMPFAIDTLPESLEKEPNDAPQAAQPVTLPLIVNGRIQRPGEQDVFRLAATAGQQIVAEVLARRLNSPLDSMLRITDASGKQLAVSDDVEDRSCGLLTHHADAQILFTAPADGIYFIHLTDTQNQGGSEFAYRLRLSPPSPDFELRVTPAAVTVRGGTGAVLTVHAMRHDGFDGPIKLSLEDVFSEFELSGAEIPAGQNQARVTLTAPLDAPDGPIALDIEGAAQIAGQRVVRKAIPAEDMMQAFIYHHLVPAQRLQVLLAGRGPRQTINVLSPVPLRLRPGATASVRLSVPSTTPFGNTELELSDPPKGITIQKTIVSGPSTEVLLQCDGSTPPGLAGNLIFNIHVQRSRAATDKQPGANRRVLVGAAPAIPFQVVSGE